MVKVAYLIFFIIILFSETKQQPRADGKIITRNYFYIDYKQFVDIVKYRIYKMRHSVEEMIKKVRKRPFLSNNNSPF